MLIAMQVMSAVTSVAAVTTQQPVVAVLYLVALFSTVSVIMVLISQGFMGMAYLIVYVGAIAMLFLFVVMLLNVKAVERHQDQEARSQLYSAGMAIALVAAIAQIGFTSIYDMTTSTLYGGIGADSYAVTALGDSGYEMSKSNYDPVNRPLVQELAIMMFAPTEWALLVMTIGLLLLITMIACLSLCL